MSIHLNGLLYASEGPWQGCVYVVRWFIRSSGGFSWSHPVRWCTRSSDMSAGVTQANHTPNDEHAWRQGPSALCLLNNCADCALPDCLVSLPCCPDHCYLQHAQALIDNSKTQEATAWSSTRGLTEGSSRTSDTPACVDPIPC